MGSYFDDLDDRLPLVKMAKGRKGLPGNLIRETFETLRPIYLKYRSSWMSKDLIWALMDEGLLLSTLHEKGE